MIQNVNKEEKKKSKKFNKPSVYSALEVANICGVVNQTAINWIRNNYLKAFKTPGGQFRVYPDDLVEFMKSRKMEIPEKILEQCTKIESQNNRSILIVDDDQGFNNVLKKYLETQFADFEIHQAFDGFEAGSIMTSVKPGFVFLDLNLPGVDGFALCQKIQTSEIFGKPKVFIVTSLEDDEVEEKCLKMGASNFFKKPVNFPELASVIKSNS